MLKTQRILEHRTNEEADRGQKLPSSYHNGMLIHLFTSGKGILISVQQLNERSKGRGMPVLTLSLREGSSSSSSSPSSSASSSDPMDSLFVSAVPSSSELSSATPSSCCHPNAQSYLHVHILSQGLLLSYIKRQGNTQDIRSVKMQCRPV